jgi:hypothetical protein
MNCEDKIAVLLSVCPQSVSITTHRSRAAKLRLSQKVFGCPLTTLGLYLLHSSTKIVEIRPVPSDNSHLQLLFSKTALLLIHC